MNHKSEATPIKLPLPPSPPPKYNKNGNAPINVDDDDDPFDDNNTSLDVHIRWTVDSGSVVQTGEKVAQLIYCYHGTQAPPLTGSITTKSSSASGSNSSGSSIIRARTKKKRWAATTSTSSQASTANSSNSNNNAPTLPNESNNNNFVTLDIRAPSNGFLRIIYKKSYAYNAVHYTSDVKSVIGLILGAIEPCEHPAVVGGLCAVCGVDITRGKVATAAKANVPIPRNPKGNKPIVDRKQQQIIDKQKKLAASIESTKELDDEMAEEWDDFDRLVGAKVASKSPPAAKPKPPPAAAPSQMRSLSSLLSGAKATQKLQQAPSTKQKQPTIQRQHQRPAVRRQQHHRTASPTNNQSNNDMSKMTVSGGVTITVSKSEAKNISDASSKKLHSEKKLCLVLDLDHTLLHATDDYRAGRFVADEIYDEEEEKKEERDDNALKKLPHKGKKTKPNPDKRKDVRSILLPVDLSPADQQMYIQTKFDQQKLDTSHNFCLTPLPQQKQGNNNGPSSTIIMRHYIKLRPNLKEFLQQISSTYQLSVYTAGTRAYAEQVAIMICRHLVGTEYDEEGLNTLRGRVREKDEECRRNTAKISRKKQLEMAKAREEEEDDDEVQVVEVPKKGGLKKAASGKPIANKAGTSSGSSKSTVAIEASTSVDSECTTASSSSSSQKRSNSGKDIEMKIPRKKKRVNFGSLLPPVPVEPVKKSDEKSKAEEELIDPTVETDRLRKKLDEAESLEIKAVELRRKMFGSRIVSRTDVGDLGKDVKSLQRVFPCGGVMAAILDDREDVWANAKNNVTGRPGEPPDNLLLVKPYHWKPFQGYADVNNASGQDLSKTEDGRKSPVDKSDEKETDAQLLWTADILRRLHERYYSTTLSQEEREGVSVPSLLQAMRKETFLRFPQVKVVFSGLIPIHKQNKQVQVRPPVVRYAEELGAEVLPGITDEVTHVVAARDRSEKIRQARKEVPSCYIVHTSWLMECYWSITRKDVRPYHMGPVPDQSANQQGEAAVGGNNKMKKKVEESKPSHPKKKDDTDTILLLDSDEEESDEDDESDDDDFAADLESEMMKQG